MTTCKGIWGKCGNAIHTLDKGWPVMRCKLTGKHPDDCLASGTEAHRATTVQQGVVHDGPTSEAGDAQ